MPSRKNHGAWIQARRDTALHNNEMRLKHNTRNVHEKVPLNEKHRQRIEREIAILIERGAKS